MALNFPTNPAVGQIYAVGTESWQWNGSAWQVVAGAETYSPVYIGSFPPVIAINGDLWWNRDSGQMFVYYTDSDSSQWVSAFNPPKPIVEVTSDQVVEALLESLQSFATVGDAAAGGIPVGGLFKITGSQDASGIRAVASYT